METLAFVGAMGFDLEAGNKIRLTVRIVRPDALFSGRGTVAANERAFWLATSTGDTIFEAIRNLLTQSPRRPYFTHNRFLVFGETIAKSGKLPEMLDFLARNGELRNTMLVMVVRGGYRR